MTYFLKKKKWMAWVVLLTFLFTSFMPTNLLAGNSVAEAAGGGNLIPAAIVYDQNGNAVSPIPSDLAEGQVKVQKTAKAVDGQLNVYDITLKVEGKGVTVPSNSADIVLVLDTSGSMSGSIGSMKTAAKKFVDTVLTADTSNRVAIVSFASDASRKADLTGYVAAQSQWPWHGANNGLKQIIDGLSDGGGTNTQAGIYEAEQILAESTSSNKMIVLLSDGNPTYNVKTTIDTRKFTWSGNSTKKATASYPAHYGSGQGITFNYTDNGREGAGSSSSYTKNFQANWKNYELKMSSADCAKYEAGVAKNAGSTIYTIGYNTDNTTNGILRAIASDGKAYTASTANIETIFGEIGQSIKQDIEDSAVNDPLPGNVDLVGNVAGYDQNGKKISWSPDISNGKTPTLTYRVKLDVEEENFNPETIYNLNERTTFTYKLGDGESKIVDFNVPSTPGYYGTVQTVGYLVNGQGQPIDTEGKVVSFENAVKVTGLVDMKNSTGGTKYFDPASTVTLSAPSTPTGYTQYSDFVPHNADGTKVTSTVIAGTSHQTFYYPFCKDAGYTVEYYYDGNIDTTKTDTVTTAKVGDVVETYTDKNITGYKLEKTENLPLTVSEKAENNVIKVYYVKDTFGYTVEYYYDGVKDDSKTENLEATYGDQITTYEDKNITGYKLEKTENLPLTVSEVAENNVIKVYYVKDTFGYTVEYYYDGVKDDSKTETLNAEYGSQITDYRDKNITGYKFEKTENLPLTVSEVAEDNVIKVYYTAIDYKVTYDYEGTVPAGAAEQLPAATDKNHVNTSIKVADEPSVPGYVFSGWKTEDADIVDGTFKMPAHDVTLVGSWTLAGDTVYTVNYYYQNDEGEYGEPLFKDTLATTTGALVFADTMPNASHVTTPSLYQFNSNVKGTVTQATVAADGTTVLNVYFDQVYRVVYKYTDGSMFNYVIDDTGYIFNRESNFAAPMLDWDVNTGADFDNVWYDNAVPENGQQWNIWNIAGVIASGSAAFDKASNTLTLYTTAKVNVAPTITGQLNVAKVVNDRGNKTDGSEEFKFELKITEIKQNQVLDPLTGDEAEKLHHYNSENRNAQAADEKAQEDLKKAVEAFKGHALTTASALSFVIADDNDISLYSVTTGSEMSWASYDGWTAFDCQGDAIAADSAQETVLNKIVEFIKDFAAAGKAMPQSEEATKMFMKDMMDYAGVATGSAITFRSTDLYELYDAAGVASMTKDAAEKKASALEDFLKEINRWIDPDIKVVFGNVTHSLSKYKNADGTYTISFTLKDKETLGFDFKVTTGSVISYVISEVDAQDADSTDIKSNTGTEYVNKLFVEGSFEVTTDSFLGYTFTNNYNGSSDPVDPWDPWTPSDPDPEGPDIDIEDPDVPLAEPDIEIEDPDVPLTDVPGDLVEIDEPEVPLGDAPRTGDSSNAIPFVVLMMVGITGLAITRRKFN